MIKTNLKNALMLFVFLLGFVINANATITQVGWASNTSNVTTTRAFAYTTVAGSNNMLMFYAAISLTANPSAVAYGGKSFTCVTSTSGTSVMSTSIWTLFDPPIGAYNVSATTTTNTGGVFGVVQYSQVSGTAGAKAANSYATPVTSTLPCTITTSANGSWITGIYSVGSNPTMTKQGSGLNQIFGTYYSTSISAAVFDTGIITSSGQVTQTAYSNNAGAPGKPQGMLLFELLDAGTPTLTPTPICITPVPTYMLSTGTTATLTKTIAVTAGTSLIIYASGYGSGGFNISSLSYNGNTLTAYANQTDSGGGAISLYWVSSALASANLSVTFNVIPIYSSLVAEPFTSVSAPINVTRTMMSGTTLAKSITTTAAASFIVYGAAQANAGGTTYSGGNMTTLWSSTAAYSVGAYLKTKEPGVYMPSITSSGNVWGSIIVAELPGSCAVVNTATYTVTQTVTETITQTATPTNTQTITQTATPTNTQTITQTYTDTPTITETITPGGATDTYTPTITQTATQTNTQTITQTITKTNTKTATPTSTNTQTVTQTVTKTVTQTVTQTWTITKTTTQTVTQTATQTKTNTMTITATATATITPTSTPIVLTLVKSVDKVGGTIGDTLTYTITYTNNGASAVGPIQIWDTIPAVFTYVSCNNGCGTTGGTPNIVYWTISNVNGSGGTGSVSFSVNISSFPYMPFKMEFMAYLDRDSLVERNDPLIIKNGLLIWD